MTLPTPSNAFDAARYDLAAKLDAVADPGLVTMDPAALTPFVLVDLVTVDGAAGYGGWSATIPVKIVVPPPGDLAAAAALGDLLELVLRTLGAAPAQPGTYTTGAGVDCPAYVVAYPADIANPDC